MKYVQYIGTKPLKRDELTGLLFAPGQQHPVQERDCARMIRHTDMYIEVAPPVGEGPQPEPGLADALRARRDERDEREAREKEESEAAAYLSVPVNVPAMPAPALRSYAMREFGVNLEGVSEAAARQRVVQLVQGREFEVGGTKLEYDETPSARPKANPEAEERAKKRGRKNAPLVVPADPRDGAGQAQNDGPQAAPNPPVGGADANALGEPVGAA